MALAANLVAGQVIANTLVVAGANQRENNTIFVCNFSEKTPCGIPQGVFLLYFLYVYIFLLRSFAAAHMAFCFVFVKNRADLVEKSLVKLFKAFCNIFMYG